MSAPLAEQSRVHPRRRPLKMTPPALSGASSSSSDSVSVPALAPCEPHLQLKKGDTFHSPTSPPSDERDPVVSFQTLPRRSPTCPRTLEAVALTEQRMADILGRLNLDANQPEDPKLARRPAEDDLPLPRGLLQARVGDEASAPGGTASDYPESPLDPTGKEARAGPHSHASDSGLGASISSEHGVPPADHDQAKTAQVAAGAMTATAESAVDQRRQLPLTACKQIERFVLVPILKEERLKPFHPLVESLPKRILNKDITCLRDLEKTLLWLAPRYSTSKTAYIRFFEFTIQCIHTTVSHLNERDQRLPTDRPYTNGYFLDLVGQIRQYAAMIAESRERTRAARAASKSISGEAKQVEVLPTEHLSLEGGLSQTGRPAELVVHKDGKAISLRTSQAYDEQAIPSIKRSLSTSSADEGVARSMARRKKNAPPMDINQKCRDCDKVFKRPCDLTKHEKTHTRPWKCSEPSCKYYEIGWPTEKERDRHVNDKHSMSPTLYRCTFAPCTYQSKRESNCKQHMEKAHGWRYERSKNNGKTGGGSKKGSSVQPTPRSTNMPTPLTNPVDLPTPLTGPSPSPYEPAMEYPVNPPFSFADPPLPTNRGDDFQLFPDHGGLDSLAGTETLSPFPTTLDFEAFQNQLQTSDPNGLVSSWDMHRPSFDSSVTDSLVAPPMVFDNSPLASTETSLNFDLDWNQLDVQNLDAEYTAMSMQLLTPDRSVDMPGVAAFSRDPSIGDPSPAPYDPQFKVCNLSPAGQGQLMLYSPHSHQMDEGLADMHEYGYQTKSGGDFTLFDPTATLGVSDAGGLPGLRTANEMFPPLLQSSDAELYHNPTWPSAPHELPPRAGMTPESDMDYVG